MTLSLRHRAALVLVGAMVSAPLWASAAEAAASTIVTFSGEPQAGGAVSCASTPNVYLITVAPGATVNFADRLGVGATLWAADSHAHLNNGQMVPVTFETGPTQIQIQMLPDCTLDVGTHEQMVVNVTAPAATVKPTQTALATAKPSTASTGAGGITGPTPLDSDNPLAAAPSQDTGKVSLGDPIASNEPTRGASGLLTLIATVSLVGVSAAAIRAIVAQRASRAITT
jgi:hypothetical protein